MIISGFAMCCGYYDKISTGSIPVSRFYETRYARIWPYFVLLVVMDVMVSPSFSSFMEAFADLTLCFGLLPNADISVIGNGWTLGIIFLFYMLFPFFCFLLKNKRRAWMAMTVSVIFNICCTSYFFDNNHVIDGFNIETNFIFCAMFFLAGGILFLYRNSISKVVEKYRWGVAILCTILTVAYFFRKSILPVLDCHVSTAYIWLLILFSSWVCYAIGTKGRILNNSAMKFLSRISMEIYLTHAGVFRIVERLRLNDLFDTDWFSYIATVILVLAGSIVFALAAKCLLDLAGKLADKLRPKAEA
jgi:peptidoglycan/LPS O-acetylase OafA/YrhL